MTKMLHSPARDYLSPLGSICCSCLLPELLMYGDRRMSPSKKDRSDALSKILGSLTDYWLGQAVQSRS